jgi:hypothetical protein
MFLMAFINLSILQNILCVEPCNFIESRNSNLNVHSPFLHFLHLILLFSSNPLFHKRKYDMDCDELMLNIFHCVLLIIWGNLLCDVHLVVNWLEMSCYYSLATIPKTKIVLGISCLDRAT